MSHLAFYEPRHIIRAEQAKRRIGGNPDGVVEILTGIRQMLVDQFGQSESFIQFANENQPAIHCSL